MTIVHYGTTWDDSTLLEEVKQTNLGLEREDDIKRHFRYDWQEVAKHNPAYAQYVERERQRLGENHPLFLTQYCLLPIRGGGHFLSPSQRAQMQGIHPRQQQREPGRIYVAGIDLAGENETDEDEMLRMFKHRQDSTVITIAELDFKDVLPNMEQPYPGIKVKEHYWFSGRKHPELYNQMVDILKNVWSCQKVVVDATGIGEPVASFLRKALGSRVVPLRFSQRSKSELGFNLLAAINSGRLKMYAADNSPEYREFWIELEKARSHYRPTQTMNF